MNNKKFRTLYVESLEVRRLLYADPLTTQVELPDGEVRVLADVAGDTFGRARDLGTLTSNKQFVDRVGGSDGADVFKFRVNASMRLKSTLSDLSSNIDMYLFSTSGTVVGRDAQQGNRSETVIVTLPRGAYYVLLLPRGDAESGYRLRLNVGFTTAPQQHQVVNAPVENDAGNTYGSAKNIGRLSVQTTLSESIGRAGDEADVFRFNIASRSTVAAKLHQLSANVDMYLFDVSGDLIGRDYQNGTRAETVSSTLSAGSYYVLILPHGKISTNYALSLISVPQNNNAAVNNQVPERQVEAPRNNNELQRLSVPLPNEGYFGRSRDWNVNSVNAPESWAAGFAGQRVIVAVLDTGVDHRHADLATNIWKNPEERGGDGIDNDGNGYVDDVYGWNFSSGNNNTLDQNGHGTHVAGILASRRNGVGSTGIAYLAKIMPVRVMNATGYGRSSAVAKGIRYAVDNGAHIINLSFLGTYSADIYSALRYAHNRNVLVVIAAGNDGASVPTYPARHSSQLPNVLSVGAYGSNNARSSFSNRVGGSRSVQVDAPGKSIYSTIPGNEYAYYKGTSMAAPHVAGVAALALSANRRLTAIQLRNLLAQGANRRVAGSDSLGGVNAAMTVPLAFNGVERAAIALPIQTENGAGMDLDQTDAKDEDLRIAAIAVEANLTSQAIESVFRLDQFEARKSGHPQSSDARDSDFEFRLLADVELVDAAISVA